MVHLIGYEDHYSFFDPAVSPFRYYRYGDRSYRLLFENSLQYQNRLLWPDFAAAVERHGLVISEEVTDIAAADLRAVRQMKHQFAARFQTYSDDVLARRHSRVMLKLMP